MSRNLFYSSKIGTDPGLFDVNYPIFFIPEKQVKDIPPNQTLGHQTTEATKLSFNKCARSSKVSVNHHGLEEQHVGTCNLEHLVNQSDECKAIETHTISSSDPCYITGPGVNWCSLKQAILCNDDNHHEKCG